MADKRKGYILLYRSFWDNPLWEKEKFDYRSAWMYLISHANYKNNSIATTMGVVNVGRGQLHTTIRHLSLIFQWDKNTVMRFLHKLEKLGMIVQNKSAHGTLLTIVNYNKYQGESDHDGKDADANSDTASDTVADTASDTKSPLLNTCNNTSNEYMTNESKKEAPPRRGGRVIEK